MELAAVSDYAKKGLASLQHHMAQWVCRAGLVERTYRTVGRGMYQCQECTLSLKMVNWFVVLGRCSEIFKHTSYARNYSLFLMFEEKQLFLLNNGSE